MESIEDLTYHADIVANESIDGHGARPYHIHESTASRNVTLDLIYSPA